MRTKIIALCLAALFRPSTPAEAKEHVVPKAAPHSLMARLPLAFEPNQGQAPLGSRFVARSGNLRVNLRPNAWQIATGATGVTMRLLGGRADAPMQPGAPLQGRVSYFYGSDPAKWQHNLPTYGRILTRNAYPGIDTMHYGNQGRLEHDFIVHPGANPERIAIRFDGVQGLKVLPGGDLEIAASTGRLHQLRPVAYQRSARKREAVAARYVVKGQTVRFELGRYDHSRPLIIDPVLSYSSYLGGVGYDVANAVAVDATGAAYITGRTDATGFPFTQGAYRQAGATQGGFVAKINPQGTGLVYCVNFGDGLGNGIAVDALGNAYVGGTCTGMNFPVTPGAFSTPQWGYEAFVMKINPTGTGLVYSSRFGGSFDDYGNAIAVDATGSAVLAGSTSYRSPGPGDFPTLNAFQPAYGGGIYDMFVTKLNPSGSGLVFSTYLGGGSSLNNSEDYGTAVAVDPNGAIYVGGMTYSPDFPVTPGAFDTSWNGLDGTVTKFTPQGGLVYSTFIGGVGHEEQYGLAVDAAGSAYVTGFTDAISFPTTPGAFQRTLNGAQDAYLAKLSPNGSSLAYGTYLGGANVFERGWSVAVDASGNAWVAGDINETGASVFDFPVRNAIQPGPGRGLFDGFVAQFGPSGDLLFSSYLGGTLWDQAHGIAVDAAGSAYVVGSTSSTNFPTTPGAFQPANAGGLNNHDDAFVLKLAPGTTQAVTLASYTITPASVPGGTNAIGKITLTAPAPAIGVNVTLLTNSPIVNIPASVTIPGGQTSLSFNIGTQVLTSTATATLSARYGTTTVSAPLTVTAGAAAPTLSSLTVSPSSLVGGGTSQGTVTLTAPAPAGGSLIGLTSSSTAAPIPSSVTIPAGASTASFSIATRAVTATTTANLTATYQGVSRTAALTLTTAPAADKVTISRAEYTASKKQLRLDAASTSSTVTLKAYVTSTGALIGTLSNNGGGKYSASFSNLANPQNITVKSSGNGSASGSVTVK